MIRELLDVSLLEDFAAGLARASRRRALVYDSRGLLVALSPPRNEVDALLPGAFQSLPADLEIVPLAADEPPAGVAFVREHEVWLVVVPVLLARRPVGYVGLGEFRDVRSDDPPKPPGFLSPADAARWPRAWAALPPLRRSGDAHAVTTARWASRMLADRCRHEQQLDAAAEELALVGDIGALLSGKRDLRTVLERIVADTARVMKCAASSLRLYNEETGLLSIAAVFGLSERYLRKGDIRRADNPIDDAALRGEIVYIEDARVDSRIRDREESLRAGIVSGLTVGLSHDGRPLGVLRVYSSYKRRFRANSRHLLRAVASQASTAIANARLAEERRRADALERQLEMAGALQARLISSPRPRHPRVEIGLVYEPSSHVGGDFCDVLTLADGRLAAAIGDVAGHGLAASLLMAAVRGALRALATAHTDASEIMTLLNGYLCEETAPAEFVSLLLVAIDSSAERITYCNAGHEPPVLRRDGRIVRAEHAGLVLGVSASERYSSDTLALAPDDFLLMYTDGAVEAMDFEGRLFGRERLFDSLLEHGIQAPDGALGQIHWDIRRFVGLAEQSDDLTMVGLRVARSDATGSEGEA